MRNLSLITFSLALLFGMPTYAQNQEEAAPFYLEEGLNGEEIEVKVGGFVSVHIDEQNTSIALQQGAKQLEEQSAALISLAEAIQKIKSTGTTPSGEIAASTLEEVKKLEAQMCVVQRQQTTATQDYFSVVDSLASWTVEARNLGYPNYGAESSILSFLADYGADALYSYAETVISSGHYCSDTSVFEAGKQTMLMAEAAADIIGQLLMGGEITEEASTSVTESWTQPEDIAGFLQQQKHAVKALKLYSTTLSEIAKSAEPGKSFDFGLAAYLMETFGGEEGNPMLLAPYAEVKIVEGVIPQQYDMSPELEEFLNQALAPQMQGGEMLLPPMEGMEGMEGQH